MFIQNECKMMSNYGVSFFKENVSTVKKSQGKIFLIALMAIGFVAASFLAIKTALRWILKDNQVKALKNEAHKSISVKAENNPTTFKIETLKTEAFKTDEIRKRVNNAQSERGVLEVAKLELAVVEVVNMATTTTDVVKAEDKTIITEVVMFQSENKNPIAEDLTVQSDDKFNKAEDISSQSEEKPTNAAEEKPTKVANVTAQTEIIEKENVKRSKANQSDEATHPNDDFGIEKVKAEFKFPDEKIKELSCKIDDLINFFENSKTLKKSETYTMKANDAMLSISINMEKQENRTWGCNGDYIYYTGYKAYIVINSDNRQFIDTISDRFNNKITWWDCGLASSKGTLFEHVEINHKKIKLMEWI